MNHSSSKTLIVKKASYRIAEIIARDKINKGLLSKIYTGC